MQPCPSSDLTHTTLLETAGADGAGKPCNKCQQIRPRSDFGKAKKMSSGLKGTCNPCLRGPSAEYRDRNREYLRAQAKEYAVGYRAKNLEACRARAVRYKTNKRKSDPMFRLKDALRKQAYRAFKTTGIKKGITTEALLGCSLLAAQQHLIQTCLDRYGFWLEDEAYEVDHIIPLCTAKTEEDVLRLGRIENLQLLTKRDNRTKNEY